MVMVNNLTLVYNIIKEHPYMLNMGKGLLAKRLKTTPEIVVKAKALIRRNQTPKEERKIPKILILDIETVPMKAYVWKRWKENISLDQTISEWFILCWSAKWLNNEYTYYDNLTPEEIKEEDDYRILSSLYNLLDEADIVKTDGEYIYGKEDLFALIIIMKQMLRKDEFKLMINELTYEIDVLEGKLTEE